MEKRNLKGKLIIYLKVTSEFLLVVACDLSSLTLPLQLRILKAKQAIRISMVSTTFLETTIPIN